MTDILLQIGATKLVLAVALSGMVWLVTRRVARPAIAHPLWLLVLGAMLVPAVVPLRILPDEAAVEAAAQSEVSPPVVVADAGATGDGMAPRGWLPLSGKPLAVLLWLLGSAGFFGWTVVRTVRFQRTLTRAARPAPQLQRLAAEIGATLGLPRVPRVYTTGARVRPLVWWAGGHVRILIPSVLVAELDETELRAVLAHELAHVRRRDLPGSSGGIAGVLGVLVESGRLVGQAQDEVGGGVELRYACRLRVEVDARSVRQVTAARGRGHVGCADPPGPGAGERG